MAPPRRHLPELCACGETAWQDAGQRYVILVDAADLPLLQEEPWNANPKGYVHGRRTGRKLHRVIADAPANQQVDHKNHYRADCRRSNLRVCDNQRNAWNRSDRRGKSRYKNVCATPHGKWIARIALGNYQRLYLGTFETEVDAALAQDAAALRHHGEFAYLNFPMKSGG